MPHIHLQTTSNLTENERVADVLSKLVSTLAGFETIDCKAIKAYHTSRAVWCMGDGARPGFIHCEVGLLSGRSLGLRQSISLGIESVLLSAYDSSVTAGLAKVTVEIREMDIETYRR